MSKGFVYVYVAAFSKAVKLSEKILSFKHART